MRILVACEESQAVTTELRRLGHEAYSCDIQDCSGGHPEWHIKGDALKIINPEWYDGRYGWAPHIEFETVDGEWHWFDAKWDMIIAHPPCTYLTAASAVRLYGKDHLIKDTERYEKGCKAAEFFKKIWNADCDRIAIENPRPMRIWGLPKYTHVIEPYYFGDPWRKRTCLWLKGCPPLLPTEIVEPKGLWVGTTSGRRDAIVHSRYKLSNKRSQKERSKTFPGIARAMAEQWAGQA